MDFDFKNWWQKITGCSVGFGAWFWKQLPGMCEGWTHVFALFVDCCRDIYFYHHAESLGFSEKKVE